MATIKQKDVHAIEKQSISKAYHQHGSQKAAGLLGEGAGSGQTVDNEARKKEEQWYMESANNVEQCVERWLLVIYAEIHGVSPHYQQHGQAFQLINIGQALLIHV